MPATGWDKRTVCTSCLDMALHKYIRAFVDMCIYIL